MDYQPGLKGITAVETKISEIDGEEGTLRYRTRELSDCMKDSFEEVAHFIWNGVDQTRTTGQMVQSRSVDPTYLNLLKDLSEKQSIPTMMRSAMSFMDQSVDEWPVSIDTAIKLTGGMPTIAANAYRMTKGRSVVQPREDLNHAANFLYMIHGKEPNPAHVRALEAYMVATMEHGLNASTFAARVVISTMSDAHSAATAAIGALKGPLHGGAPSGVIEYLDEVQQTSVKDVVDRKVQAGVKSWDLVIESTKRLIHVPKL
ncbi:citrate/2-methylcitrate synthase [Halobacillus litoralis]|uniref:citrate/2-methylcitrate synthase n=1 Tax=Halobacillus litoralis TaxID=45668 RepID=UPI00296EA1DB|nr:citrate/2-methylcitrate synthase [Halobacillus litoralis]